MPVIRCPRCAQRQVVAEAVVGQIVGCSRCERTYTAEALRGPGKLRDLMMVAAALVVGAVVSWMLIHRV